MSQVRELSLLELLAVFEQKTQAMIELLDQPSESLDVDLVTNILTERGTVLARMQNPERVPTPNEQERMEEVQRLDNLMRLKLRAHLDDAQARTLNINTARKVQESYNAHAMYGSAFFDRKN